MERCEGGGVGGYVVKDACPAEDSVESVHAGGYESHVKCLATCFGGVEADWRCVSGAFLALQWMSMALVMTYR